MTQHGDVLLMDQDEPTTYQEDIKGPNSEKWLEAMRSKMESMYTNQVWTLIDPTKGVNRLSASGFSRKKLTWMVTCKPLRDNWW